MSADPATIAFYQAQAAQHTARFGKVHSRHLDAFLDRLTPGATILELGCGGGRDAARMREPGFMVDATDAAPAMVQQANDRFHLGARIMRFDELAAVDAYDAVWAHACLIHVTRDDLPDALSTIGRALKRGGLHYASFKLGNAEQRDLLGRLHNFPTVNGSRRPIVLRSLKSLTCRSFGAAAPMGSCATGRR